MSDRFELGLASAVEQPTDQKFDTDALFKQYQKSSANVFTRVAMGPNVVPETLGTGFIIDVNQKKDFCRIATDNHVATAAAATATPLLVRLSDGKEYSAKIEKSDEANDLAILRVSGVKNIASVCKPIPLVDGLDAVKPDDMVIKITSRNGSPQYSVGKVWTYFDRSEATGLSPRPGENLSRRIISIKGPADTGDSGGAILTRRGAIGIQDANGPNLMGATPAMYLKRDLEELKKND